MEGRHLSGRPIVSARESPCRGTEVASVCFIHTVPDLQLSSHNCRKYSALINVNQPVVLINKSSIGIARAECASRLRLPYHW